MNRIMLFLLIVIMVAASMHCSRIPENDFGNSVISVEEWGGERFVGEHPVHELQYITLHHGGVPFLEDADPMEYLRNLQMWSRTDRGWIDIPYHYLIDLEGNIYEGRELHYAGDTNTNYDPTGHALVCVLGNFGEVEPSERQLQAVVDIFTWICQTYNIPPETLKGHKDYTEETVCPGDNLYAYLVNGYFIQSIQENILMLR